MGNDTGNASSGAQRHAEVRATFSNDDMKLVPLDDGMHGDGRADDGIYAYAWTPQISGKTTIIVRAANCRSDSEGSDNVTVLVTQPDLNITSLTNSSGSRYGQPIEISITVTNLGNGIAQNHTDNLSIDGELKKSFEAGPLKPGESWTWNYPYIGKAGNHTIRACSDSMNEVYESNENNNCRDKPFNISFPADLNITSLSYNLTNPVEGQPIEISFTVTNLGNGTAQNHTDTLSIDEMLIQPLFEAGPLKPGESRTLNYPYIGKAGNYTLWACSDSMNEVFESNENNNCRNTTINISFPADLNITSLNYSPKNPVEGQPVEVTFTVTNLGNGTAQNHTDNLSIDGELKKSFESGPLKPGESHAWNYIYNGITGNNTVSACSDSMNEVYESNENNNCGSILRPPPVDLNITSLSYSPENPVEGQPIEISFIVTNLGKGTVQNHTDTLSIDGVPVLIQSNRTGPLKPGESWTWNNISIWKAGNHTIRACSDSMDEVYESNENNNCRNTTINISFPADLNISSLTYSPKNPVEGQPVEVSFTVTNLGNSTAQNHMDNLSIDGELKKSFEAGPLKPGESWAWNYTYNETASNQTIRACSDSKNKIEEKNETNNCKSISLPIMVPDLSVTSLSFSSGNPREGQSVEITFTVTNLGNGTAENCTDNLSIDGVLNESFETGPLKPGESRTWNTSSIAKAGNHTVRACSDLMNDVYEFSENNNCMDRPLDVSCLETDFAIKITDKSGSDLREYPVLIDLCCKNYPDRLQDDSQLIFLDQDRKILNYWVEELDSSSKQAKVWVKVPYVPKSKSSDILLNISLSSQPTRSNGSNTFEFFDDFDDESLDDRLWAYKNDSNSSVQEESGSAKLGANSFAESSANLTSNVNFEPPRAVRFRANLTEAKMYERMGMGFLGEDVCRNLNDVKNGVYWRWQDQLLLACHVYPINAKENTSYVNILGAYIGPGYNVWEIKWLDSKILYYADGKSADPHKVKPPIEGIPIAFSLNLSKTETRSDISIDWALVRKCVDPEPSVIINKSTRRSCS
jgi:subtilase family serine protease